MRTSFYSRNHFVDAVLRVGPSLHPIQVFSACPLTTAQCAAPAPPSLSNPAQVVFDEAAGRKVIFSTFDPDCATLLSLKQPRYPVFFLTCGGTKHYIDPRMNSLEAALQFALSSHLQGVVAEATSILGPQIRDLVQEFHRHGMFLFTWGDVNNEMTHYLAQREAGVDAVIMDDLAKMAKVGGGRGLLLDPSQAHQQQEQEQLVRQNAMRCTLRRR